MKNPITESPIIKNVCEVCGKVTYDPQRPIRICCNKETRREALDSVMVAPMPHEHEEGKFNSSSRDKEKKP